ncbi:MAG: DUF2155 domain-containing protein [Sphingobacteriia bacterium]|nr:DUF2155 domain-containing protein [Sphingobacteriia bacterium]
MIKLFLLILLTAISHSSFAEEKKELDNLLVEELKESPSLKRDAIISTPLEKASKEGDKTLIVNPNDTKDELGELLDEENKPKDQITYKKAENVEITILDKVSTKTTNVELKLLNKSNFKNYEIIAYNCYMPSRKFENHMLLVGIWEYKNSTTPEKIFLGWLFSEDKHLNHIQHRFIDIINFKCK